MEPYGMNTVLEYLEAKGGGGVEASFQGQISCGSGSWVQTE